MDEAVAANEIYYDVEDRIESSAYDDVDYTDNFGTGFLNILKKRVFYQINDREDLDSDANLPAYLFLTEASGVPFFNSNKNKIWKDAIEELTEKHGGTLPDLLDVCPKGYKCRQDER